MSPRADDERVKPFLVPDLGEGLEEVTVLCWNVALGDNVELNQTLCSVETAKAEVEIPSPYAGRIVEIRGAEGEVLPVGSLLVRIDTDPDTPETETPQQTRPAVTAAPNGESSTRRRVLVGYGTDDVFDNSRRTATKRGPEGSAVAARPKAKPAVRKLAAELLVDLNTVPPGPDGVITREAVLVAAGVGAAATYDVLPVRGVQAHMAERMTLSRNQIPDAHASVQVDCTNLLGLRDRLRVATPGGDELITPFVLMLRLLVVTLTHHKLFNSTWVDGADGPQVHCHHAVHLGFGVATSRGLLVPVVADAQDKTTRQLAEGVARLIREARAGTLKPAELQGSTFTVSNFGALGLDEGVPVINYPEAAILGMGSLKPRPMVIDDAIVIRPQMTLTCAFDHRIVDGAKVAQFLGELRQLIESPEMALLDL